MLEVGSNMEERCTWSFQNAFRGLMLRQRGLPPKPATAHPTENFVEAVIQKDPDSNDPYSPTTQNILEACCGCEELPSDPIERQKQLCYFYTQETPLYHEMNQ